MKWARVTEKKIPAADESVGGRRHGVYMRLPAFTSVYESNMDDAVQEPEKKNCTFLFKRRRIRSNATRKRKESDGSDGESSLINVNFVKLAILRFYLSIEFSQINVLGYV